jgi:hypothetical protein
MTVMQLLNEEGEGSLEGFEFDPAVCRRAFDHYDKDKSGYLDAKECMKLADVRSLLCSVFIRGRDATYCIDYI